MNKRALQILQMRLDGMSYFAIGKELGISRQRVQQLISPPTYIKNLIVGKAQGKCQLCGIFVSLSGDVHHIGNNGENYNDVDNLQLLCKSCHRIAHSEDPRNRQIIIRRVQKTGYVCLRCGHITVPRKSEPPRRCGGCKSPYWAKPGGKK